MAAKKSRNSFVTCQIQRQWSGTMITRSRKGKKTTISCRKRTSVTADSRLANKGKSKVRVLSHTRRDCAKNKRIAGSANKQMTEYSELMKRSVQKKWNLDQFLEEASQRERNTSAAQ